MVFSVSTEGPFVLKAQGPLGGFSVDDLNAINQKINSYDITKTDKNSDINDTSNIDKKKKTNSKYSTDLKIKMSTSLTNADSGMSTQDTFNGTPNSIGRIFSLLPKVQIDLSFFE